MKKVTMLLLACFSLTITNHIYSSNLNELDIKPFQPSESLLKQYQESLDQASAKKHINRNQLDKQAFPPLHRAVYNNDMETVQALIHAGANIHEKDKNGFNALHWAKKYNFQDIAYLLESLESLHKAVQLNNTEQVEQFLQRRNNPNQKDEYGLTPLHYAVQQQNAPIIQLLIAAGANPKIKDKYGFTASHWAKKYNLKEIAYALESLESLHKAVQLNNSEQVERFLQTGSNPNQKDEYGFTPLHYAAQQQNSSMIQTLLDSGADPTIKDNNGYTAFHASTNPEVIKTLLQDQDCPVCLEQLADFDPDKLVSLDCCNNKQIMCKNCFDQSRNCPLCRNKEIFKKSKTFEDSV